VVDVFVNPAFAPGRVPAPSDEAQAFHAALEGYAPTPVRELPSLAAAFGLAAVGLKDESDRMGLPAFKILGASWATERVLREAPGTHTLVAASAGNHGRAVARVAAGRGLAARIYLPARSIQSRRDAIASEGAEVVVVEGTYEDAVTRAAAEGAEPGVSALTDTGAAGTAAWVIDGYATLFAETQAQFEADVIVVPAGVGSLAAAAARHGAAFGIAVVAVEPDTAPCLTASLAAGAPTAITTSGTTMAGLDCAEISPAAWPSLRYGIAGTLVVSDREASLAVEELDELGLAIGPCGAATLAALRKLVGANELGRALGLGASSRLLLIATEGRTDR
jgi:diaminopropionate ammonia-lyase